jgi:hypothetical protein
MAPILGIYASQISGHLFAPSGAYDSIATVTLTSTSSSITFNSIPSTYTHLQIRMKNAQSDPYSGSTMYFNGDTGSNYYVHAITGNGTAAATGAGATSYGMYYSGNTTSYGANVIDILDYTSTSKNKTSRSIQGFDLNGSGILAFVSQLWLNTAAITSVTFTDRGQPFQAGTSYALYGIKGN